jgi:prevent-host-death family protein
MRSVNIAELKNSLSKYLRFAKRGEEIIIRDRNLPVAKLVPFSSDDVSESDLQLVAEGKMRLGQGRMDLKKFFSMKIGGNGGSSAVRAVMDDRDEGD